MGQQKLVSICIALSLRKRKGRSELVECLKVSGECTNETVSGVKGNMMKLSKYFRPYLGIGRNSPISIPRCIFFPFPFSENYIEIFPENYIEVFDNYRCVLLDVDANLSNDIL